MLLNKKVNENINPTKIKWTYMYDLPCAKIEHYLCHKPS